MNALNAIEQDSLHKSIMILIPEDLREKTIILKRIREGKRIRHFETIRLRKAGSPVVVSLSILPITDDAGSISVPPRSLETSQT
jgi:PAS domain-containing protein